MLTESPADLRQDLLTRLADARAETDRLFGMLSPGVLYDRPIRERHRIVFYIGHLEAFDGNLLRGALGLNAFHAGFDRLFAFGIDPVDGGLPQDKPGDWPKLSEVGAYRQKTREQLDARLAAGGGEELGELMNIAIEHRLMHAETLEYMFHQLPYEAKLGAGWDGPATTTAAAPEILDVPAGQVALGLRREDGQFGWDNEFECHTVDVPAFSIDKFKVTNGQFAEFLKDGGYTRRDLWAEADWEWRTKHGIRQPVFWVSTNDGFRYRGMFGETAIQGGAPVYVSHAEAAAYARWAGKALPTEAEWQRAAVGARTPPESRQLWDPPAVGSRPELESDFGLDGMLGTGWEWTATKFAPFPGFRSVAAYPGYSADFFDGKHFVMKGGSPRTAGCLLRMSFRNWFQPHYQYVYAGFRCVAR